MRLCKIPQSNTNVREHSEIAKSFLSQQGKTLAFCQFSAHLPQQVFKIFVFFFCLKKKCACILHITYNLLDAHIKFRFISITPAHNPTQIQHTVYAFDISRLLAFKISVSTTKIDHSYSNPQSIVIVPESCTTLSWTNKPPKASLDQVKWHLISTHWMQLMGARWAKTKFLQTYCLRSINFLWQRSWSGESLPSEVEPSGNTLSRNIEQESNSWSAELAHPLLLNTTAAYLFTPFNALENWTPTVYNWHWQ